MEVGQEIEGAISMETIMKVTKDMLIADVVRKYPSSVEIMLKHGLHCFGCGVSLYETIEQGTLGHGMSDEQMNALIDDLNKDIEDEIPEGAEAEQSEFTITSKAATKVKEFLRLEGKEGWGLRVGVIPGGCSGLTYLMDFQENAEQDDLVFDVEGVKFFVSKEDMEHLGGSTLDYIETLHAAGFKIDNPNVHSTCGCGKSFR